MTHRVGPKGQVVIPKQLRDTVGLRPGDEVDFALVDGRVLVRPVRVERPLRGRFGGSPLTRDLERARAEERAREQRR